MPTKGLKETIESAGFDADNLRSLAFNSSQSVAGGSSTTPSTSLTDDQKSTIDSILKQYKSSGLTTDNAQSIIKQFQDAGIGPSDDVKDYVQDAGYDLDQFTPKQSGMPDSSQENYFWAAQNSSSSLNTSALSTLQSILNQYDLTHLSSDQETSLYSQLSSSGLLQSGSLYNLDI
jgi:hypothetical protein